MYHLRRCWKGQKGRDKPNDGFGKEYEYYGRLITTWFGHLQKDEEVFNLERVGNDAIIMQVGLLME